MFPCSCRSTALLVASLIAALGPSARADSEQALTQRLTNQTAHEIQLWAASWGGRLGASREPEGEAPAVVAELVRRSRHRTGARAPGFTVEPGETVQLLADGPEPERPAQGIFEVRDLAGQLVLALGLDGKAPEGQATLAVKDLRPGGRTERRGETLVIREAVPARAGRGEETKGEPGHAPAPRPVAAAAPALEPLPPSAWPWDDTLHALVLNQSGAPWILRCYQKGVQVLLASRAEADGRILEDPATFTIRPGEVVRILQSRAALCPETNREGSYVIADRDRRAGAALVWDTSRKPPVLQVDEYRDPFRHLLATPGAPLTLGREAWLECRDGRVLLRKVLTREQVEQAKGGGEAKRTADPASAASRSRPASPGSRPW